MLGHVLGEHHGDRAAGVITIEGVEIRQQRVPERPERRLDDDGVDAGVRQIADLVLEAARLERFGGHVQGDHDG